MKLLKSREIQIKKEEVSSSSDDSSDDSTSSCSSSDDSSDEEKFKPEQKYKPSSTKRSRRRSSSPEDVKPKIVNSTPIDIDSDPITIQSSDEEAKVEEERIKYIQGHDLYKFSFFILFIFTITDMTILRLRYLVKLIVF